MWFSRNTEPLLRRYARQFPVVLVTGARQTGKTSLLRHCFPDTAYVTLDDPAAALRARNAPADFLASLATPCIIDEVQYAPGLFRHLKIAVDAKTKPGRYYLTGSQQFGLMHNVSESLAGRCGVITLMTLSVEEIRSAAKISVRDYIMSGGYPAVHAGAVAEPADWYPSYTATYLERDVRNVINVTSLSDFNRLLRSLALRTAQSLSLSDLARDVGIAPNTVRSWLSVLNASGIVHPLEPYFRNMGKRLVKSPKVYFCDTGLLVHLLGIRSWDDLVASPLAGAVWETYAFNQVFRSLLKREPVSPPLWFWRTRDGHEVDFIIERGGVFTAIEAKMKELPDAGDIAALDRFASIVGEKAFRKGYVLCPAKGPFPVSGKVEAHDGVGLEP